MDFTIMESDMGGDHDHCMEGFDIDICMDDDSSLMEYGSDEDKKQEDSKSQKVKKNLGGVTASDALQPLKGSLKGMSQWNAN